jgi:MFS family permease
MVGGSIADVWPAHERGLFMSIYSLAAMGSVGIAATAAAYIETSLGWRWIQWIHCMSVHFMIYSEC